MSKITKNRFSFLISLGISFLIINFTTRVVLLIDATDADKNFIVLIKTFSVGLFYDVITGLYYFIPLIIYLVLIPTKLYNYKMHKLSLLVISLSIMYAMLFNSVSEYFFWEEFGKRFNFIAVDYLVYTHEVIKNIQESYPLPIILTAIFFTSVIIVFIFKKRFFIEKDQTTFGYRLRIGGILLVMPIIIFNLLDKQSFSDISSNIYNNELAKNGTYSLFSAFRHNELKYSEFYRSIDEKSAFANLRKLEKFNNKIPKIVKNSKKPSKKNIILIMVESLSAEYMGAYGNKKNLTPNLDNLTKKSLFFNNLFATGTRTVRGMEAVVLSVPPTAGRSIIKRPVNDTLDSIGDIFRANGYVNKFIYAGHGYFDNMNDFFSKNGFDIIDRLDFNDTEITFSNVWGVCDEDLLNKVLSEADKTYKEGQPFFSFVMTTSNHRPYTYPDNKIDIPSHTGRDGAVKYTDFAISSFIEKAEKKAWFKDTVFVVIADHNGGSAGKTSLPLYRYKIPFIVYDPSAKAQIISKLSSQIDVMPTLFSILGISYSAKFYGNNILDSNFHERAFVGNYQKLGYVEDNYLYYLTPDKKIHKNKINNLTINSVEYLGQDNNISKKEEKRVVTYYQSASIIYEKSKN